MVNYYQVNEHILLDLEKYMFSSKNIAMLTNLNKNKIDIKSKISKQYEKKDDTIYFPRNKDGLFWQQKRCFFFWLLESETSCMMAETFRLREEAEGLKAKEQRDASGLQVLGLEEKEKVRQEGRACTHSCC